MMGTETGEDSSGGNCFGLFGYSDVPDSPPAKASRPSPGSGRAAGARSLPPARLTVKRNHSHGSGNTHAATSKAEAVSSSCFGLFGSDDAEPAPSTASRIVLPAQHASGKRSHAPSLPSHTAPSVQPISCCICHSFEVKYCCPGCSRRTCSLTCCRRHKEEYECDGVRDCLPFVRIPDFTDKQLVDDYFLLESVDEGIDRAKRQRLGICKTYTSSRRELPTWMGKLRWEARLRGTGLKFSPSGSSRAMTSKTLFNYKENTIYWTVEWVFASSSGPEFKITDQSVRETKIVADVLQSKFTDQLEARLKDFAAFEDDVVLLRHAASDKFHVVDTRLSLQQSLAGKMVIDFPTFLITHKDNKHMFKMHGAPAAAGHVPESDDSTSGSETDSEDSDDEAPIDQPVQRSAKSVVMDNVKEEGECSTSDDE